MPRSSGTELQENLKWLNRQRAHWDCAAHTRPARHHCRLLSPSPSAPAGPPRRPSGGIAVPLHRAARLHASGQAGGAGAAQGATPPASLQPHGQANSTARMAAAASGITFTVAAGPCAGQVFSFTAADTVVVGRKKGCSMWLKDPSVSERHAQLWYTGGAWHLADEGSTNGTHLARLGEACIKGGCARQQRRRRQGRQRGCERSLHTGQGSARARRTRGGGGAGGATNA